MSTNQSDDEPINGEILENTAPTVAKHPAPYSKRSADTLTAKQSKFVDEILAGKLPSEAYKAAYDTSKMNPATISHRAQDLLRKNGHVKAFIDHARARKAELNQYNKAYVLEKLAFNAEVAAGLRTQKLKRVVNGEVTEIEAHFVDRASSNRALELVGKEAGMFIDRREVGTPGEFARLDEAELASMLLQTLQSLDPND